LETNGNQRDRRPLRTRQYRWPHQLARFFVRTGMTPDDMSLASIACAFVGALAFWRSSIAFEPWRAILLIVAAVFIQLRLVANLLDGLMAVEEGKKTPLGALFNEMPDRAADVLFLAAAGYAADWPTLGWVASVLAVATAYVRAFGASLTAKQDYCGPMAKPQRMFALTVGSILAVALPSLPVMTLTLCVIICGGVVTIWRRVAHLANEVSSNHDAKDS
jgi:phosphatidylglycerophosphate synthase